jgi:hypothetical protein
LFILSLACAKKDKTENLLKDDSYFPLAIGNYWRYRVYPGYGVFGYDIEETKIIDTVRVNDTLFYKLKKYPRERDYKGFFLYKDSTGNVWAKDSLLGPSWLYQKKLEKNLEYIHQYSDNYSYRKSFISVDTVEVPAGEFECLKFKVTPLVDTIVPPYYMWYSKGVGYIMARFELKEGEGFVKKLVRARVNGVKYP